MVPDQQAVSSSTAFSPPPLNPRFQPPSRLNSAEEEFPDFSEFLDLADNRVLLPVALPRAEALSLSEHVSDSAPERRTLSEHVEQAGCLAAQTVCPPVCPLVYQIGQSVRAVCPPNNTGGCPAPTPSLSESPNWQLPHAASHLLRTRQQKVVLGFCAKQNRFFTTYARLSSELHIAYGTLRGVLRRLNALGLVLSRHYSQNGFQGLEIEAQTARNPVQGSLFPAPSPANTPSPYGQISNTGVSDLPDAPAQIDRLKTNQSIWNLDHAKIKAYWPHAAEAGLAPRHLQQVAEAFAVKEWGTGEESRAVVVQSLQYLDWQLENGGITDRTGAKVSNPVAYWLRSMENNGAYKRPTGYVDLVLEAKKEALAALKERLETERATEKTRRELDEHTRKKELDATVKALAEQGEHHVLWPVVFPLLGAGVQEKVASQGTGFLNEYPARALVFHAVHKVMQEN